MLYIYVRQAPPDESVPNEHVPLIKLHRLWRYRIIGRNSRGAEERRRDSLRRVHMYDVLMATTATAQIGTRHSQKCVSFIQI